MKLETPREPLLTQLATVSRVATTRSAVQALSGVQLQASQVASWISRMVRRAGTRSG